MSQRWETGESSLVERFCTAAISIGKPLSVTRLPFSRALVGMVGSVGAGFGGVESSSLDELRRYSKGFNLTLRLGVAFTCAQWKVLEIAGTVVTFRVRRGRWARYSSSELVDMFTLASGYDWRVLFRPNHGRRAFDIFINS